MGLSGPDDRAFWLELARHRPLGILTDLDGTLLPFAPTPDEARPSDELVELVRELAAQPETSLVIVSGRPRATLDEYFPVKRGVLFVAEHGAWRSRGVGWERTVSLDEGDIDSLTAELDELVKGHPGSLVERKTWSVALHYRKVPIHAKTGFLVQAAAIVDAWTASHRDFEALGGAEVLEIRPRAARKANAVAWVRELLGPATRLLIAGDDITDEDMFGAASPGDATVLVGPDPDRHTSAEWRLRSTAEVHALYRWILSHRAGDTSATLLRPPERGRSLPLATPHDRYDLLVLSNRLPELRSSRAGDASRTRNVGGLVSALGPALSRRKGIWLGWSGRSRPDATGTELGLSQDDGLDLAWVDFPETWHRHYYNGLCNGTLWPMMHSFPGRLKIAHEDWRAYEAANDAFASLATRLVGPDATVWAHDYHLLLLGARMRAHGHSGPVGLFQHVPFPGPDILFLLPWASELLEAMLQFDLVGFHTAAYVENFLRCMATVPGVRIEGLRVIRGARTMTAGAFPIGIIPEDFQQAETVAPSDGVEGLMRSIHPARLVLGVDRLDYTKGIPERLLAFGRFLELFPAWRRRACLVQVSVPSRGDVPEYVEQRARVENIVGRVNGELGEADWVPIRYLYRSYARSQLSELYRAADVGYVTPLRDGMNLVAKEFVAARDPTRPGVLLLSRFAGAAEELTAALLTNPWDCEGMARDLERALQMPESERLERHQRLMAVISRTTAVTWAEAFLTALGEARPRGSRRIS